ncbi:MAG: permease-like cell division protein FtsX [Desulfosarcinaceae bacterium]|nr:permease-like cell division protein FtsX [Desulfosarcinaceae bacterium]
MPPAIRRALRDIALNRFLNAVTVVTITLAVIFAGAFGLFFYNVNGLFLDWQRGIRMMVYLEDGISDAQRLDLKFRIKTIAGVAEAVYISRAEALETLKTQLQQQSGVLDHLRGNPLPDAFELTFRPTAHEGPGRLDRIAAEIEALPEVGQVLYAQQWLQRFSTIFNLFKLVGYGLGGIFGLAAILIVANTIRLMIYNRRDEIEIMRLVGAADGFINAPFYICAMLLGAVGSLLGLTILLALYSGISRQIQQSLYGALPTMSFFPWYWCIGILIAGMLVGALGCLVSMKQYLKA